MRPVPAASTYGIAYLTAYESIVLTAEVRNYAGMWIYIPAPVEASNTSPRSSRGCTG